MENNNDCINLGYSHYNGVCQDQSKWMSNLKDTTLFSALSLPGTHDTMSLGCGGDIAQNQSKELQEQLTSGIRFLDIRLAALPNSKDKLYLHHGPVYLGYTFEEVLDIILDFIKKNNTETIFMLVRQEFTTISNFDFYLLLANLFNKSKYWRNRYPFVKGDNPLLKVLRGKFIVVTSIGFGLSYDIFNIQDAFYLRTNWDLYSKWEKVKAQLSKANTQFVQKGTKFFINFLSGSGGSFPYFVASGHSNPDTYAPRLATGLTEPAFHSYYPDFPRVNWFGIFATIAFEGTNILAMNYINKEKLAYVGMILADFPGQGLINSIIDVNKRAQITNLF